MWYGIMRHTPFWVWIVLLVVLRRGIAALKSNAITPQRLFLLPIGFLIWSLSTCLRLPRGTGFYAVGLLLGLGVGTYFGWRLYAGMQRLRQGPGGTILRPGSVWPLLIALGGFVFKYSYALALILHPAWVRQGGVLLGGIGSGVVSGLLLGGAGLQWYRARQAAPVAAA